MDDHKLAVRIYLEDTDAQGIVFHANYLKYFERARSEILESLGIAVDDIAHPERRYVVYEAKVKFRSPVRLGERVDVVSNMRRASDYRLSFHHEVHRGGEEGAQVTADVDVVCIDARGKLIEIPEFITGYPAPAVLQS